MMNESRLRFLLVAGILAVSAVLAALYHFRIDLTESRSYTVSPYTVEVLSELDSPMNVTWYLSTGLSGLSPAVRYIGNFLEEYRASSGGRFSYTISDPLLPGNSPSVSALGLVPRQVELETRNGRNIQDLYSGLLVEYRGLSKTIPFLIDTDRLEYDLTRTASELLRESGPVGKPKTMQLVYGKKPEADEYGYVAPWLTYAGFNVLTIRFPEKSLDPSECLLVIGSSDLSPNDVVSIRNFLDQGGRAAFFVSGNTVKTGSDWTVTPKTDDPLLDLLSSRGFTITTDLLLDVVNFRLTMPALDNSRYENINYPFWITVPVTADDQKHPLLSGISSLQFFWPSEILVGGPEPESIGIAVASTPQARRLESPCDTNPFGKQLSVFSGDRKGSRGILAAETASPARTVVVADEYLPGSMIEYTASESNLDFLVNCAEWISGDDQLLGLKKPSANGIAGTDEATGAIIFPSGVSKVLNLAVIPVFVLLAGLVLARKRYSRT
jgi:ABC-type uncharacterized transport system involved in gliding motility, auxiliary component